MEKEHRTYIAIDLKSFFASVECVERGLSPLTTNLLVADVSRTEKTICLAVSPSLKAYGIGGRARLFEAIQRLQEVNNERRMKVPGLRFTSKSWNDEELKAHPDWEISYIAAKPQMAKYIQYSRRIYEIYLKYVSPEDIHIYSIDEVFMDVTTYLDSYKMTAHELTMKMIHDVLDETGITATSGIGTNLYLCKIAMDIMAKHIPADKDGVRIAELDERTYREKLWNYTPITKFWRVGKGIAEKLSMHGMYTMGDVALCSIENEELLYKLFGVNAELLIDHAWGWEPCTMEYIKAYKPESNSISSGQVLQSAYDCKKAKVVINEMIEALSLKLVRKHLVTDQIVIQVNYDTESLTNPIIRAKYNGPITQDYYGRQVPKAAHGMVKFGSHTSSYSKIFDEVSSLYDRIVHPNLLIRRLNVTANHVIPEDQAMHESSAPVQLDLFTDYDALQKEKEKEEKALAKERRMQEAILNIKEKFGKNALLRGVSFQEGATARERNKQIGGHHE